MNVQERRENSLIDLFKFLFSILIVLAHYAAEYGHFPALLDRAFSLYIVVVPFFFACSGYFLEKKILNSQANMDEIFARYIKRILCLYAAWSVVYCAFKILSWLLHGVTWAEVAHYIHTALVFTTYPTIWFLPACVVAALITWMISKKIPLWGGQHSCLDCVYSWKLWIFL